MTPLYESRTQADLAAEKLKVFAQPQRLMVLSLLLARGEQNVSEIDAATRIGQPALSQQLAELRKAGMVTTRRQAKQVYYRLADAGTTLCVRSLEAIFGEGAGSALPGLHTQAETMGIDVPPSAAGFARIFG